MLISLNAQDVLVRGEIDLDHDVVLRKLLEQAGGIVSYIYVHAVADAFGMTKFNGLPDVETQPLRRHQARRKLTGVKADVNLGIIVCR